MQRDHGGVGRKVQGSDDIAGVVEAIAAEQEAMHDSTNFSLAS